MVNKQIALNHPLFSAAGGGFFRKSDMEKPVFVVKLGDIEAGLSLDGICREFNIARESDDGKMLSLIADALEFVTVLRVGDTLPSEVLTGEPSWEIKPVHRLRAYQRLTVQLTTWLTGEERVFTNAGELSQIAEDPAMKKKIHDAFDEAAKRLGYGKDGREAVMTLVSNLAEELAFIEALRERYEDIVSIGQQVQALRRIFARENSIREIADAVMRLMILAMKAFQVTFDEIDAQTGEILSVLKNPPQQIQYIRKTRDRLYCRIYAWNDLLQNWAGLAPQRDERNISFLRETYRFLAPRFMPAVEWQLMSKPKAAGGQDKKQKTCMIW